MFLETFWTPWGTFGDPFGHLGLTWEPFWQPLGSLGCLWASILTDLGICLTLWARKLVQGTGNNDFFMFSHAFLKESASSASASALLLLCFCSCFCFEGEAKPRPFLSFVVLVCSIMSCSFQFHSALLCSTMFYSLLFYSVSVCPGVETLLGELSSLRRASRSLLRQVSPEALEAWYLSCFRDVLPLFLCCLSRFLHAFELKIVV